MSKTKKVYSVIMFLSILVACETYTTKKVQITPPFNHSFIRSAAVIEFSNSSERKGAGKIIADRIEQLLLNESSYKVFSRMDIDQILNEKKLDVKGILSSSAAMEIGKILGVNALIVGNVENYDIKFDKKSKEVTVAATFKVLDTSDGRVVWSKTAYGLYRSYYEDKESDFECFEKAIDNLMTEVRYLFPHEREEQVLM